MMDDKRLEEMANESDYYEPVEVETYITGFRACELRADKLADALEKITGCDHEFSIPCGRCISTKALSEYRGEKS